MIRGWTRSKPSTPGPGSEKLQHFGADRPGTRQDQAMADDNLARSDEERAADLLIAVAQALLNERSPDVPKTFVADLFARAVPEDLMPYDGRQIAAMAESAWSFLGARTPGLPKLRIYTPGEGAGERLRTISVLEIVNDDMPFLLDSVLAELTERDVEIRLVVHPVFSTRRDGDRLTRFEGEASAAGALRESFIHIHLGRIADETRCGELVAALEQVLADVRVAVQDWRAMRASVVAVAAELKANPPPLPKDEIDEAAAFLDWLAANNFTFLGARNYVFNAERDQLQPQYETGLGLLRSPEARVLRRGSQLV